jgi:regulator of sirC expression with transglutaminase-like and TPR domain
MPVVADPRAAFRAAVAETDDAIDLAGTLLLVAAEEYPDLEPERYVARLDDLADAVRPRLSGDEGPAGVLAAINGHLYRELGFRGNAEDYYDPRNSYLNEVLDRRTGLPITLAVVYLEVARRLSFPLVGVNLPMHFMLAHEITGGEPLIVDAFDGGRIMTARDCQDRLSAIRGEPVELRREHFQRATPRSIVARVLNNLRGVYTSREEYGPALAAVERMQIVQPSLTGVRDRGLLLFRLRRHDEAEAELAHYLQAAPTAPDRDGVAQHLDWIRRIRAERGG